MIVLSSMHNRLPNVSLKHHDLALKLPPGALGWRLSLIPALAITLIADEGVSGSSA